MTTITENSSLADLLGIPGGVTAITGSGGKTTLMHALAAELMKKGSVIVSTSTHILPSERFSYAGNGGESQAAAVSALLEKEGVAVVGTMTAEGKLAAPAVSFEQLAEMADYVLVEADGSRGLPLKAHAGHEPAVPRCAGRHILVAGMDGIGRPVGEVCHRPELWARLAGCGLRDTVTVEMAARVLEAESLGDFIFLNKADDGEVMCLAKRLAGLLSRPAAAGSLKELCN